MLEVTIYKRLTDFDLNVSFKLNNGVLGLMGASGSGKSMILKCIAGIERPDAGRIVWDDVVLFDSKLNINVPICKRNIGYMFQNYALFDNMSVFDNVASSLKVRKVKDLSNRVMAILKQLQIDHLSNRYPRQLSGGQRQRVALARLLIYQPSVILLDEPFSAIDEDLKEKLMIIMKQELKDINQPVLLVSHNKNEIDCLCEDKYIIKKGKIVNENNNINMFM